MVVAAGKDSLVDEGAGETSCIDGVLSTFDTGVGKLKELRDCWLLLLMKLGLIGYREEDGVGWEETELVATLSNGAYLVFDCIL